jgi:hypothetical protein
LCSRQPAWPPWRQCRSQGCRHVVVERQRRQVHEAHALREAPGLLCGHGTRQRRLANAAGTHDVHQTVGQQQVVQRLQIMVTPEQRRRWGCGCQ